MKRIAFKLFFVSVFVTALSLFASGQTISVSGSINKTSVKRGKTGKGSIILTIPKELHVNSNKPTSEFMIPTEIDLSSNTIKNLKVVYPKGKDKKFDFSEEAINVYEEKTLIPFTFQIPKRLKGTTIKIRALISYQACSNEVCYQPQKEEIFLKAKVL